MDNSMIDHYQAVLRDLEQRRVKCQRELMEIEPAIAGIRKVLAESASLFAGTPQQMDRPRYAGMSVRWAILNLLAEDSRGPMETAEIAQALQAGGISSKGKNFNSNVSAVLSTMGRDRGEVASGPHGYTLTDNGTRAWQAIKLTPQYLNRGAESSA
ncbi:MAG: hypothetical protein ACHP8B_18095, partial [Terriglobales bacterium]